MARVKGAMMTRKRRNKTLKLAKSYWGSKSTHFKMAKQAVKKSGVYAYIGRKQKKRRNKTLKLAKSYWGSKSTHFKMAKQAVKKSGVYAYIGRKQKKRDFRRLWIARISAAVKPYGMNYSRFMNGLKKSGIEMNRKSLSELAITDAAAFGALVETAKKAL